ncbi:MAG: hypothetical protein AAGH48_01555 [Pseudomonadota bacterium]
MVSVANEIAAMFITGTALYVLIRFLIIPGMRNRLWLAASEDLAKRAGALAAVGVVGGIAAAAAIAGALLYAAAFLFDFAFENADRAADIVAMRDRLEQAQDAMGDVSAGVLIGALAVLGLIVILIRRSSSVKVWSEAAEARRTAIEASLSGLSAEEIASQLEAKDPTAATEIKHRISAVTLENKALLDAALRAPLLKMGDGDATASLNDLTSMAAQIRADTPAAATAEERANIEEVAANIEAKIAEIRKEVTIPLASLSGAERTYPLAAAADHLAPEADDVASAWRAALTEAKFGDHEAQSAFTSRKEPEMLREWIAAGATSRAAVDISARFGRTAALAGVIALFFGLAGVGVVSGAPGLISQAKLAELSLLADEASEAIAAAEPDETEPEPGEDLASDEETEERLRAAFYRVAASELQTGAIQRGASRVEMRRNAFRVRAVSARRDILALSSRPAAPSLDPNRPAQEIRFRSATAPQADLAPIDEAMERRLRDMRSNESSWRQMRRWAATPASRGYASDAMLRTMIGSSNFSSSHALRSWAESSSSRFAAQTVRAGAPPAGASVVSFDGAPDLMTARDRRVANNFAADAPSNVDQRLASYRSGAADPGSLHRSGVGGRNIRANTYETLFPASQTSSSPRSTGGASRSYGRVRFSGRVGGVVLGRPPEGGQGPDLVGFAHVIDGGRLYIRLTSREGRTWRFGPYRPEIAHHALSYAADGRVVTSTLPQASTNAEQRIQVNARRVAVHPAFEDTAFACAAIQVDRFVDGFMFDEDAGSEAVDFAAARQAVSVFGRVLTEARELPSNKFTSYVADAVAPYAQSCGAGDDCFPVDAYKVLGFDFGGAESYLSCLSASGAEACAEKVPGLAPLATYAVDSGVREQRYSLDPDLAFLRAPPAGNPLWPLDFIVQAVPQTVEGADVDSNEEWEPWTFPNHEDDLRTLVAIGIFKDPYATAVFNDMAEFVVLQRLFRNALDGALGTELPLGDLVDMHAETRAFVTVRRHERWNVNEDFAQLIFQASDLLAEDFADAGPFAPAQCASAVDAALAAAEAEAWPGGEGLWPHLGLLDDECAGLAAFDGARDVRDAMREQDLIDEAIHYARSAGQPRFYCAPAR